MEMQLHSFFNATLEMITILPQLLYQKGNSTHSPLNSMQIVPQGLRGHFGDAKTSCPCCKFTSSVTQLYGTSSHKSVQNASTVHTPYRGADKSLARPDQKNNWKVAIFLPTRRSLLLRRPGWTDKLLNFFEWLAKVRVWSLELVSFLVGLITYQHPGNMYTYWNLLPSIQVNHGRLQKTYCSSSVSSLEGKELRNYNLPLSSFGRSKDIIIIIIIIISLFKHSNIIWILHHLVFFINAATFIKWDGYSTTAHMPTTGSHCKQTYGESYSWSEFSKLHIYLHI